MAAFLMSTPKLFRCQRSSARVIYSSSSSSSSSCGWYSSSLSSSTSSLSSTSTSSLSPIISSSSSLSSTSSVVSVWRRNFLLGRFAAQHPVTGGPNNNNNSNIRPSGWGWCCGRPSFTRGVSGSSLYVNRAEESRTPAVNVALNLAEKLDDVDSLKRNFAARNVVGEVDLVQLVEDYRQLMKLVVAKETLEKDRKDIANMMAALSKVKETQEVKQSKEILKARGKSLRETLKTLNADLNILEETVVLQSLKLPNTLHPDTPADEERILKENVGKKDLSQLGRVSHVTTATENNWIKFSDIGLGAYFLLGPLAWLERHLIDHFSRNLHQLGFHMTTCPEIFRSVVAEGCGLDISDPQKVFTLEGSEESTRTEHLTHLVGVSPMSFAAFLTRMSVDCDFHPRKYFSVGKSYCPIVSSRDERGLYGTSQTTKCEVCSVCSNDSVADHQFQELLDLFWNFHSQLDIPCRVLLLPAAQLELSESKKVTIDVWLPSLHQYLTVASVCLTGTYVSERLMISSSSPSSPIAAAAAAAGATSSQDQLVHLVHADINVTRMLAVFIEFGKVGENQPQLPSLNPTFA
ncbi:serine--tRNA synthetase-like protein Slimp [Argonauta hians]